MDEIHKTKANELSDSTGVGGEALYSKASPDVVQRIAQLTREVRASMRELGLDQAVHEAAHAIPDARDRLRYVGRMTEQAANRVLTAAEKTGPLQEDMSDAAQALDERRQPWFDEPAALPEARALVLDTRQFFEPVQAST